ncbi:MAG: VWA domain-containing protein [Vampirovibrionales bacterium]|nr:VWA domain-containing protein [Vampirovibrionales bacterium]
MLIARRSRCSGFSLVETAVVMLFVSLAMVPIITTMGGSNDANNVSVSNSANISGVSSRSSKLVLAANSIMERSLAGDHSVSFDASTLFTTPGETVVTPRRQYYGETSRAYNQPITYDWVVRDLSHLEDTTGQLTDWANQAVAADAAEVIAPTGNFVQQATLRLYQNPGDANPVLTLPTYFYRSNCGTGGVDCGDVALNQTGIAIVMDRSGSMRWSIERDRSKGWVSTSRKTSAPWLKNRYPIGANVPDAAIRINDIFDDSALDLTYMLPFSQPDNPDTPYAEHYIQPGGAPLVNAALTFPSGCNDVDALDPGNGSFNPDTAKYFADGALTDTYVMWNEPTITPVQRRAAIAAFCGAGGARASQADWLNLINNNMSRLEALRNALLSLLVKLEQNQFLVSNMEMGMVSFAATSPPAVTEVSMEKAVNPPGPVNTLKFVNMRLRSAMINRQGVGEIIADQGTPMLEGLKRAASMLYSRQYDNRLMIVISDGYVNSGSTPTNVRDFAKQVGGCPTVGNPACYSGSGGKTITMFTVGLIEADDALMTDMAQKTPNGQFFLAQSVTDLQPIFDQIAFQIERLVLNSMARRYHLPVKSGD